MLNYLWGGMIIVSVLYGMATGNIEKVTDAALASAGDAVELCITMLGIVSLWMGIMEVATKAGALDGVRKILRPFIRFMFPKVPVGHKSADYIADSFAANILGLGWAATPAGLAAMRELEGLERERGVKGYVDEECAGKGCEYKGYTDKSYINKSCKDEGYENKGCMNTEFCRRGSKNEKEQLVKKECRDYEKAYEKKYAEEENEKKDRKNNLERYYIKEEKKQRTASDEMCTFLIMNISSLQLIPVNMIAYRSQYGSINPAEITGPAIVATLFSTIVAVVYCKWKCRQSRK